MTTILRHMLSHLKLQRLQRFYSIELSPTVASNFKYMYGSPIVLYRICETSQGLKSHLYTITVKQN